jgi:sugar lactone lactonase YvrE
MGLMRITSTHYSVALLLWGFAIVFTTCLNAQVVLPAQFRINTVAGDGIQGFSGDGGLSTSGEVNIPKGVAVDSAGNIYIADTGNSRIRKVTASTGDITTVVGDGTEGFSGDGGPATGAALSSPAGLALDSAGNIYIADTGNNRVRVVNTGTKSVVLAKVTVGPGDIATIAGNGINSFSGDGGAAISAEIDNPIGIALDSSGNIYIADSRNNRIRKVTASTGDIATVAGISGLGTFSGDGGPATSALMNLPTGVALDASGNIYIADSGNGRIRKVTVSTGIISTVAGGGTGCSTSPCPATSVALSDVVAVAFDKTGNFFLSNSGLFVDEVVVSTGNISIAAGNGSNGPNGNGETCANVRGGHDDATDSVGDGCFAVAAQVAPYGIAIDSSGNLYIADTVDNRIRAVGKLN